MIRNFNELIAFEHTIFSLPFIIIAMLTASYTPSGLEWFGWELFFLGILAAISARNFAMAFNRYCDRDIDKKNPRTASRPSVDGRVNSAQMLFFIGINAVIFMVASYYINALAFSLCVPFLVILAFYSYMKRFSFLAHVVLGVCLGLAPIAGAIAIAASIPLWSIFLSLGVVFWVAGFDVLYSLQDMDFDKKESLYSIPSCFGEKRAIFIARLFHLLTLLFWFLFLYVSPLGEWSYMALVMSALMLGYEHYMVAQDFKNIPKAFFVVNGYLGIIFLVILMVDMIL